MKLKHVLNTIAATALAGVTNAHAGSHTWSGEPDAPKYSARFYRFVAP